MRARAVAAALAAAALVACGGGPDERGAHVETFDLRSEAVGRELPVTVTRPPHADEFFAGLEALGRRAPVVVQPCDDAQDFAEHDLIAAAQRDPSPFLEQPVWLDVGDDDPFRPGAEALAAALRAAGADVRLEVGEGEHDGSYWDSRWRRYLRFYADALARC